MTFKQNNPGCNCCGPCCSVVWGYLLDEYSTGTFTLYGNDTALLSPSPYVQTQPFVSSFVSGGVTYYVCSYGLGGSEILVNVPDYYAPTDPRRSGKKGIINPSTGLYPYTYSNGGVFVSATVCEPSPTMRVFVNCEYSVRYDSTSPVTAITGAGYVLDPTYTGSGDQYKKVSGDITHLVTQDSSISTLWHISSVYDKTVTGSSNIMSGFPSTITVEPAWNPFSMKSEFVFS